MLQSRNTKCPSSLVFFLNYFLHVLNSSSSPQFHLCTNMLWLTFLQASSGAHYPEKLLIFIFRWVWLKLIGPLRLTWLGRVLINNAISASNNFPYDYKLKRISQEFNSNMINYIFFTSPLYFPFSPIRVNNNQAASLSSFWKKITKLCLLPSYIHKFLIFYLWSKWKKQ